MVTDWVRCVAEPEAGARASAKAKESEKEAEKDGEENLAPRLSRRALGSEDLMSIADDHA